MKIKAIERITDTLGLERFDVSLSKFRRSLDVPQRNSTFKDLDVYKTFKKRHCARAVAFWKAKN